MYDDIDWSIQGKLSCGCENINGWFLIICEKHDEEFNRENNPWMFEEKRRKNEM